MRRAASRLDRPSAWRRARTRSPSGLPLVGRRSMWLVYYSMSSALITFSHERQRAVAGAVMIVGTSLAIQIAGGFAHGMFPALGPRGVSSLRFFFGAVILLPVVRPAVRGRSRATWLLIAGYGASLAALNLSYFEAISRVPLGLAVTLGFVPPLVMAAVSSRRTLDLAWVLLAGGGVLALERIDPPRSASGVLLAVGSGVAWLGVAYTGRALGQTTRRADGLALALPVAAAITLPFGLTHISRADTHILGMGLMVAVGGLILPFALELEALRRLDPRTIAIVYSIDPLNGALAGLLLLGQQPAAGQIVAMIAIVSASAGATLTARSPTAPRSTPNEETHPPAQSSQ